MRYQRNKHRAVRAGENANATYAELRRLHEDQLLMRKLRAYRPHWPWWSMRGSAACLKWGFRDLQNLESTLKIVPGRRLVVQAGGNLGLFPKRLAEEFEEVYTFEPDSSLFYRLRQNASESNIHAYCAAVGCSREGVSLKSDRRDNSGKPGHEGLTYVAGPGSIQQLLIDDLNLPACDLIYLDIEGYEFNALRGAVETIAKYRPVIAVEINRNSEFAGVDCHEFRRWILDLGYRFEFKANSDEIFSPEVRL